MFDEYLGANATARSPSPWVTFPPSIADRVPLTPARFASGVLPVLACYYLSAVLVCKPGTRAYRLALLPVALTLAYRAGTVYDATLGGALPNSANLAFSYVMASFSLRILEWSFVTKHYTYVAPSHHGALRNGFDLLNNPRGIGWTWGRSTPLPHNPSAGASNGAFTLTLLITLAKDIAVLVGAPLVMALISPSTFASPDGGTIFTPSLPLVPRALRACALTALFGVTAFHGIEEAYTASALLTFLLPILPFRTPAAWPPLAERPWRAYSLAHFWSACWHQWIRRPLLVLGAAPGGLVAGRAGAVLGAFAVSEALHDLGMWGLGGDVPFTGFFLMMGVGMLLEEAWARTMGVKVGGWAGRVWTMAWVVGWGTLLVDAWLRRGVIGEIVLPPALQRWAATS